MVGTIEKTCIVGCGDHGLEYMTGGRAVILGSVGKNFAAGMSGGIAWVLDEDGTLEARMNNGHAHAYPVSGEREGELRGLLEMHVQATGSRKAAEILENFPERLKYFRMIISDEYLDYLKRAISDYPSLLIFDHNHWRDYTVENVTRLYLNELKNLSIV